MNVLPNNLPLEVGKLLGVKTNNILITLTCYSVRNLIDNLKNVLYGRVVC